MLIVTDSIGLGCSRRRRRHFRWVGSPAIMALREHDSTARVILN